MRIDFAPHPYERDVWVGLHGKYAIVVWVDNFWLTHDGEYVGAYAHINEAFEAIRQGKKPQPHTHYTDDCNDVAAYVMSGGKRQMQSLVEDVKHILGGKNE